MGWKFTWRQDQCEFIVATMEYVICRCDERILKTTVEPFDKFACARTKERAIEIRDEIKSIIG